MTSDPSFQNPEPGGTKPGWTRAELVIWRFKWLIALGTLACLLATAVVTWNGPRAYRVRAVIDLGDLRDEGKDVERLVAKANAGALGAGAGGPSEGVRPGVVSVESTRAGLVEVALTSQAPETAVPAVRRTAEGLLAELDRLMDVQRTKYLMAKRAADELRAALDAMRAARDAAMKQRKSPADALVLSTLVAYLSFSETKLSELETQARLLELRQAGPRFLIPADIEKVSIRRRLAVNLAISLAVGVTASVAFAFAWQYARYRGRA